MAVYSTYLGGFLSMTIAQVPGHAYVAVHQLACWASCPGPFQCICLYTLATTSEFHIQTGPITLHERI